MKSTTTTSLAPVARLVYRMGVQTHRLRSDTSLVSFLICMREVFALVKLQTSIKHHCSAAACAATERLVQRGGGWWCMLVTWAPAAVDAALASLSETAAVDTGDLRQVLLRRIAVADELKMHVLFS
nr:hypothetical protein Iba_chr03bCG6360 [Ipomoea batatas]